MDNKELGEPIFVKLFEAAEIAKFTVEEYHAYEESLKIFRDWKNVIDTAELKGERKKAVEMAALMKVDNEPIDKIIRYTGLSEDEINSIVVEPRRGTVLQEDKKEKMNLRKS